jgi:hypothetical protein
VGWSYVVRYDPRGRPIKYIVPEEDDIEEDQQDDAKEQVDVSDEEVEDVDDVVLNDDFHDGVINNDIDDDVAMANPFNDYDLDDTNIELDEEEY